MGAGLDKKLDKLQIKCNENPLDVPSAEKLIFGGSFKGAPAVILKARSATSWKYERELEVFQAISSSGDYHENIIRMFIFIPPKDGGPCMVLEKIEPMGFDLYMVTNQWCVGKKRSIPRPQWMHYLRQLCGTVNGPAGAVGYLHSKGWVHCDIKVDNVLVGRAHTVKLIDFGKAQRVGEETNGQAAVYMPPEFLKKGNKVSTAADMWLIGGLFYFFIVHDYVGKKGCTMDMAASYLLRRRGILPEDSPVIKGLLEVEPEKRCKMDLVQRWLSGPLQVTESPSGGNGEFLDIPDKAIGDTANRYFHKAHVLPDQVVKAFGLEVSPASSTTSKMVNQTLGSLNLGKDRVTALFIDRRTNAEIETPMAETVLKQGDWVFFKVDPEAPMAEKFQEAAREGPTGVEIFLDFDEFTFPDYCVGASVYGEESLTREQQAKTNALNLRKKFGINLIFVVQGAHFKNVTTDLLIQKGDRGFVVRIPSRDGTSRSTIDDARLARLMDEAQFRKQLNLTDSQAWSEWQRRGG